MTNIHYVDPNIKKKLEVCNKVIKDVNEIILNRGQANQQTTYNPLNELQKFQLWRDYKAVNKMQSSLNEFSMTDGYKKNLLQDIKHPVSEPKYRFDCKGTYSDINFKHPRRVAGAALAKRVGVCQDHACVSYLLLRSYATKNDWIHFVGWVSGKSTHYYCVLDTKEVETVDLLKQSFSNNAVVVDPWIKNAEAVLWHHSVHSESFVPTVVHKAGKGLLSQYMTSYNTVNPFDQTLIKSAKALYPQEVQDFITDLVDSDILGRKKTIEEMNIQFNEEHPLDGWSSLATWNEDSVWPENRIFIYEETDSESDQGLGEDMNKIVIPSS